MKGKLASMISRLMELLAPANCLECGREGAVICTTCRADLRPRQAPRCFGCSRLSANGETCEDCRRDSRLAGVSVATDYEGSVKELVLQLKFHRLRAATETATDLLMGCAGQWPEVDLVTSVPVAASRYRERGYNQSELLARAVARRIGLPYRTTLGRLTATHQIGQDRLARRRQVAGAFYGLRQLRDARVLIVDDVVTTGATLSECAAVLDGAGAGLVWAAGLARH